MDIIERLEKLVEVLGSTSYVVRTLEEVEKHILLQNLMCGEAWFKNDRGDHGCGQDTNCSKYETCHELYGV